MMAHEPSLSLIRLDSVESTNTYLAAHPSLDSLPHGTIVSAATQSAGRGQRGNSWEAEPRKNITMTMLLRPVAIAPSRQFVISEAVSVAIVMMLRRYMPGLPVTIKWPNDIYVADKKISGILIEHTLAGAKIDRTIVGIGLNVNQTVFVSNAPNPVSMAQLTGSAFNLDELLENLGTSIMQLMARYDNPDLFAELHDIYRSMLWRRDTPALYIDTATGTEFAATLVDVAPDGMLNLADSTGTMRRYAFKEVAFVL